MLCVSRKKRGRFFDQSSPLTKAEALNILGLEQVTTLNELDTAYRKQALIHHPDKNGDPNIFVRLGEARKLLITIIEAQDPDADKIKNALAMLGLKKFPDKHEDLNTQFEYMQKIQEIVWGSPAFFALKEAFNFLHSKMQQDSQQDLEAIFREHDSKVLTLSERELNRLIICFYTRTGINISEQLRHLLETFFLTDNVKRKHQMNVLLGKFSAERILQNQQKGKQITLFSENQIGYLKKLVGKSSVQDMALLAVFGVIDLVGFFRLNNEDLKTIFLIASFMGHEDFLRTLIPPFVLRDIIDEPFNSIRVFLANPSSDPKSLLRNDTIFFLFQDIIKAIRFFKQLYPTCQQADLDFLDSFEQNVLISDYFRPKGAHPRTYSFVSDEVSKFLNIISALLAAPDYQHYLHRDEEIRGLLKSWEADYLESAIMGGHIIGEWDTVVKPLGIDLRALLTANNNKLLLMASAISPSFMGPVESIARITVAQAQAMIADQAAASSNDEGNGPESKRPRFS